MINAPRFAFSRTEWRVSWAKMQFLMSFSLSLYISCGVDPYFGFTRGSFGFCVAICTPRGSFQVRGSLFKGKDPAGQRRGSGYFGWTKTFLSTPPPNYVALQIMYYVQVFSLGIELMCHRYKRDIYVRPFLRVPFLLSL